MKAAGPYRAGSKGLDGGNTTLYQFVKSLQGLPHCIDCFPRMRLVHAPLERMSDETKILTWKQPRHPSWNWSHFGETARALKNKRAPDVCLVESGHQNQTRRLAQRFCWLDPAVPPPLPPSPIWLLVPCLTSFFPFLLLVLPLLLLFIKPLDFCPPFYDPSLSSYIFSLLVSTLSFGSSWKTTGEKRVWIGKTYVFSFNSCSKLWQSTSP